MKNLFQSALFIPLEGEGGLVVGLFEAFTFGPKMIQKHNLGKVV